MEMSRLGHLNALDMSAISSLLAFPSTGGDLMDAFHVPSSCASNALVLAFGFTFI